MLRQSQLGQGFRQAEFFEAVDAADPGRQRRGAEVVGAQAAASIARVRCSRDSLPTPTAEVAVKALIWRGGMREGGTVRAVMTSGVKTSQPTS